MSLNTIQFSPQMIAGLFRDSLVVPESEASAAAVAVQPHNRSDIRFLGENRRQILIVVDVTDAVFLPDEDLGFLTNMLTACKLSLADVAIINYRHHQATAYRALVSEFNSAVVLLFGISPVDFGLPINFPEFQVQTHQQCRYLFAPRLGEISGDNLLKSKLWVCLRQLFQI